MNRCVFCFNTIANVSYVFVFVYREPIYISISKGGHNVKKRVSFLNINIWKIKI